MSYGDVVPVIAPTALPGVAKDHASENEVIALAVLALLPLDNSALPPHPVAKAVSSNAMNHICSS
jgi:hypothetical protein